MILTVEKDRCAGCGKCLGGYNGLDLIDNLAVITQQPDTEEEQIAALQAVDSCPTNALQTELSTG